MARYTSSVRGSTEMNSRRLTYLVPAALIAVASLVRIVVCLQHNPMDYLQLADPGRHWMNGLRFPKGAYFGASDPIGYQIYSICAAQAYRIA